MVSLSSLSKLILFSKSEKLRPMKEWSSRLRQDNNGRKNKHIKKLKSLVREILNIISGKSIVEMLKGEK